MRPADAPLPVRLDGAGTVQGLGRVTMTGSLDFGGFLPPGRPDINGAVTLRNARRSITVRLDRIGGNSPIPDRGSGSMPPSCAVRGIYANLRGIGTANAQFGENTIRCITAAMPDRRPPDPPVESEAANPLRPDHAGGLDACRRRPRSGACPARELAQLQRSSLGTFRTSPIGSPGAWRSRGGPDLAPIAPPGRSASSPAVNPGGGPPRRTWSRGRRRALRCPARGPGPTPSCRRRGIAGWRGRGR